jgi:indole-3-glycerol phosphate synthase
MTILDVIIANKKKELAEVKKITAVKDLESSVLFKREINSLSAMLQDKNKTGIIAEFKRKSPSKGIINSEALVAEVASGYFREGASGVSILTENKYFGGSPADLSEARKNKMVPILRKDFIIDEYQVIESKAYGADAILLIAAALPKQEVFKLAQLARSLGLEVLFEIHRPRELDLLNQYVNIIGVNNRDLKTFDVNTETSFNIAERIPSGFLKISESGLSSPQLIKNLRIEGYDGFLIGQRFMSNPDPARAFAEFVKGLNQDNDKS